MVRMIERIEKTAIDFIATTLKEPTIYSLNNIDDIFEAIEDALKINPKCQVIHFKMNDFIHEKRFEIGVKYGFDTFNLSKGILRFRGYTRWVFFKDNVPVYFTEESSGMEEPPYYSKIKNGIYETLEFDRHEKINF
jgi:hypothetical protein